MQKKRYYWDLTGYLVLRGVFPTRGCQGGE